MDSPLDAIGGPDCEARSETAARGSPVADDQELERGKKRPRDDASADDAESGDARSDDWSAWGNLWQVPAIVLSAALIFLGISIATHRQPDNDFRGALDQVEQLLTGGQLDLAASQLNDVIEPNLYLASQPEQARFHALVGDWIAASQADQEIDVLENHRRVAQQYATAEDLGARMGPARLERFALALIAVGDREEAQRLLAELDGLSAAGGDAALDIRRRRNHVLRRFVDDSLRQTDLPFESLMKLLEQYRRDPLLRAADSVWAVARMAELRLERGFTQEAVDRLLVDMRRFEIDQPQSEGVNFGELYTLLARGYYDLGEHADAEFNLHLAMGQFIGPESQRGDTLVLLGQVDVANGRWREAFERFDEVVRDFVSTRSYLPGLLGRAEVHSVLGDHNLSLADYQRIHDLLPMAGPRRDVTAQRVAHSLTERHEATLMAGKLEVALQFVTLAKAMFEPGQVPVGILLRLAYTSRQRADDLLRSALGTDEVVLSRLSEVDPATRHEAIQHYRRAGDYYVRHARGIAGASDQDETWADSLWLAADSYDLAGYREFAATHFTEYIAGRSEADPRRPEAIFRLGQCYQAESDFQMAVNYYEQVLVDHPRSQYAAGAHVPLARCFLELGRRHEAQQRLEQVLQGNVQLDPNAPEYREALFELGALFYDAGEYVPAIENLSKAYQRYPEDARSNEILFQLADSHRRHANDLRDQLEDPVLAPSERQRLGTLRAQQLEQALELYSELCRRDDPSGPPPTDYTQRRFIRDAYLYQGDCAFELELFDQAVQFYDATAQRFPEHHSSLTALIQIVNCYYKLGDPNRARVAHNRALVRLRQLPESVFEAPDSLLDRDAWARWLQNIPLN